jgi:thioredoxin-like negative regulator of GroEL
MSTTRRRAPDEVLDRRPEVAQQRLDLAPVEVAAGRVAEQAAQQLLVLVAHA